MHNFWALVKWHGYIMVCYVGGLKVKQLGWDVIT